MVLINGGDKYGEDLILPAVISAYSCKLLNLGIATD
jgi:hypothetical protein